MSQPTIFISYSHKDEAWKERLAIQLRVLALEDAFNLWEDRQIVTGDEWKPEIEKAINQAALAILLISADFLTSNFIRSEEVPRLLQRRRDEGMRIFPIILKPCPWRGVGWLAPLQVRPKDGKPLTSRRKYQAEEILADIAVEIQALLLNSQVGEFLSMRPAPEHLTPAVSQPGEPRPAQTFPSVPRASPANRGTLHSVQRDMEVVSPPASD